MSPLIERIAAWLKSPARSVHIYLAAAGIGLATFLIVYGVGQLLGTNTYWQMPEQDERMALIGYRYFLQDSWHWPIFLNDAINVPYPKSVAFLDCIPIWALVNKTVATIVPPWKSFSAHAYLGLWHGLAYALQPVFGVACLRALRHRSWRAGLITALLFLSVPTWIFRYPHPALSAHWILLWALLLYLRTTPGQRWPRRAGFARIAQLVVAALVTPYHAVMSLPILAASVLRARDRRTIALWLPLGAAAVLAAYWFAGYFASETMKPQWGFEWESANLLGWLIPQRSGIIGDAQWIASANGTPWQYEGYAYLGLGVLGLLLLFLPRINTLGAALARHRWLFAVLLGAALLALSNHVFFGSHELFAYPIPKFLRWIPHQFRSPGRFVWLPTYALMAFLLHFALLRFSTWRRFAIVGALVLLQLVDATGDWRVQARKTRSAYEAMLDLGGWRSLVDAHDAVFIAPPYSCVYGDDAPTLDHASMEIQLLASERALPINGTYSAREMRKCVEEEHEWPTLALHPRVLYVLLPQAFAIADRFTALGARCGAFAYGRVCSTETTAIDAALRDGILRVASGPIPLHLGERLDVATAPTIDAGWTAADRGGRWTTTSIASLLLQLSGAPSPPRRLHLLLQAPLCGARVTQDVEILVNSATVTTLHLTKSDNAPTAQRDVDLPSGISVDRPFALEFRPHDIRSAQKLGCGSDQRPLGVWVSQVWFE